MSCALAIRNWQVTYKNGRFDILMDTYFNVDFNCKRCGRCVTACESDGEGVLWGGRGRTPDIIWDYVPCHHCKSSACIKVCHYDAISISRY